MTHTLPKLPYATDALAPTISAETLELHHGKHHATYVKKLNELIADTPDADKSLDELVTSATGKVFNNAAQHWNHSFYWKSMSPDGGGNPKGDLADAIKTAFGSLKSCVDELTETATNHFGSGWAWLVSDGSGALSVMDTHDADLPLRHGKHALLTIDVWEHAYYVDYRNVRADYVKAFFDKLANWDFAAENFTAR